MSRKVSIRLIKNDHYQYDTGEHLWYTYSFKWFRLDGKNAEGGEKSIWKLPYYYLKYIAYRIKGFEDAK